MDYYTGYFRILLLCCSKFPPLTSAQLTIASSACIYQYLYQEYRHSNFVHQILRIFFVKFSGLFIIIFLTKLFWYKSGLDLELKDVAHVPGKRKSNDVVANDDNSPQIDPELRYLRFSTCICSSSNLQLISFLVCST